MKKIEGANIKRGEEKKLTEQEILKVAARLFFERGYDNTSTRELSKAVGLSNAGIYYHFKGKEDILYKIISESTKKLCQSVHNVISSKDDPVENLSRVIEVLIKAVVDDRTEIGILLQESNRLSIEQLNEINTNKKEIVDLVKDELARLKNQERLKEADISVSAFSLMGMANWTFYWYDPNGSLEIKELVKLQLNGFLNGILKPDKEGDADVKQD